MRCSRASAARSAPVLEITSWDFVATQYNAMRGGGGMVSIRMLPRGCGVATGVARAIVAGSSFTSSCHEMAVSGRRAHSSIASKSSINTHSNMDIWPATRARVTASRSIAGASTCFERRR
jgi:hypothetical protein